MFWSVSRRIGKMIMEKELIHGLVEMIQGCTMELAGTECGLCGLMNIGFEVWLAGDLRKAVGVGPWVGFGSCLGGLRDYVDLKVI